MDLNVSFTSIKHKAMSDIITEFTLSPQGSIYFGLLHM